MCIKKLSTFKNIPLTFFSLFSCFTIIFSFREWHLLLLDFWLPFFESYKKNPMKKKRRKKTSFIEYIYIYSYIDISSEEKNIWNPEEFFRVFSYMHPFLPREHRHSSSSVDRATGGVCLECSLRNFLPILCTFPSFLFPSFLLSLVILYLVRVTFCPFVRFFPGCLGFSDISYHSGDVEKCRAFTAMMGGLLQLWILDLCKTTEEK